MSSNEHTLASLISQLVLSLDGAVLGTIVAFAAVDSFLNFKSTTSALRKIRQAPSVKVSDLRSLIHEDSDQPQPSDASNLVVLRGRVQATPDADGTYKSLKSSPIINPESNENTTIDAVIVQRTQRLLYNEWKGFLWRTYDLKAKLAKPWREQESSTIKAVPFVLGEAGNSDFVVPNFDGSGHPLPLVTVYQQKQLFNPSPFTFLQKIFGHDYPIGLQDEEKVLPLGVEVSAVGICSFQNGIPEIKSCRDLPYFMSLMDKDELVLHLEHKTNTLFWFGVGFGLLSVGILCYAGARNWHKFREWRQRRQPQQASDAAGTIADPQIEAEDEEVGEVPDGQLCVICLMRRRRSAFIPCGHLVCCHLCCISIEQSTSPKCPVCRQEIRTAMRIYDS
ncbi:E3 ubiquitin-protein ligase SPL2 [Rosa sericea]